MSDSARKLPSADSMWVTPTRLVTEGWTDEQKATFLEMIEIPDIPEDEARRLNAIEDGDFLMREIQSNE